MKELFKKYGKPALAVAIFVASMHALWAALVAIGVGQTYLDWIFPMHFIVNPFNVLNFNIVTAALLVVVSFIGSYVGTMLFAIVWKSIVKKK
jgi:hypothetical protein